ncbi:MAG TPA: hypothetical protein VFW24_11640 [Acidimicrobiales bacterium]|nr:hypothetical protein [Acidimicrobiales bacterium]
MTPFQQVRLWARRAPWPERVAALLGAALVVTVVSWLLVPSGQGGTDVAAGGSLGGISSGSQAPAAGGPAASPGATSSALPGAPGAAAPGATGGAVPSGSAGAGGGPGAAASGGPAPAGGGSAPRAAGGCTSPPGSDAGVTATQMKVAIILVNIVGPAANSTFGLESPSDQQAAYQAVVNSINASGGIACRKLVPTFFQGDPVDQSQLEQTCQNVISSQPFFVFDYGAYYTYPQIATCYLTSHIPFMTSSPIPAKEQSQFYPYLFSKTLAEVIYKDTVFALQQRGFFSAANGFKKLGLVYRSCEPEFYSEITGWLHQAGVPSSAIVAHDVGCPTSFDTPSDQEQAILAFKSAGVTNVTVMNDNADFSNLTTIAQQQGFKPKWGIPDDGVVPTSYGNQHPDYGNIANALAITGDRYGEEKTPGYPISPGTAKCNAIFSAARMAPVYQQPVGTGGSACDMLWMLQIAAQHAPAMQRAALAAGLHAAGSFDPSYPWGANSFASNSFTGANITYADEFWRVDQFMPACSCWQVVDRNWHPAFQ